MWPMSLMFLFFLPEWFKCRLVNACNQIFPSFLCRYTAGSWRHSCDEWKWRCLQSLPYCTPVDLVVWNGVICCGFVQPCWWWESGWYHSQHYGNSYHHRRQLVATLHQSRLDLLPVTFVLRYMPFMISHYSKDGISLHSAIPCQL